MVCGAFAAHKIATKRSRNQWVYGFVKQHFPAQIQFLQFFIHGYSSFLTGTSK